MRCIAGIRCGGRAGTASASSRNGGSSADRADGDEGEYTIDDFHADRASTLTLMLGFSFVILSICALSCFLIRERLAHAWRVWAAGSEAVRRTKSMELSGARRPQRLQEETEDGVIDVPQPAADGDHGPRSAVGPPQSPSTPTDRL